MALLACVVFGQRVGHAFYDTLVGSRWRKVANRKNFVELMEGALKQLGGTGQERSFYSVRSFSKLPLTTSKGISK